MVAKAAFFLFKLCYKIKIMKNIKNISVKGKKVLLRTNYDVPLSGSGRIVDDFRIKESIPTIKYLVKNKAKVLIISHIGRPKGEKDKSLSLKNVSKKLKSLLNKPVIFVSDIFSEDTREKISKLKEGGIILFENIRFYEDEEKNYFQFAKNISKLADIYVNDAFAVSHRAHASVDSITRYIPSFAGLSLEKEISELSKIKDNPRHPFVVIIGGHKVSDKISVILNLIKKADYVLVGGASANTMFKAKGYGLGSSFVEDGFLRQASNILNQGGSKIILPIDVSVSQSFNSKKEKIVDVSQIPSNICQSPFSVFDIGPKTIIKWDDIIKTAKTVFWSGPLGVFENPVFAKGSKNIAKIISENKNETVIGGGDTIGALSQFKIKKFTHISTGGSAMLKYVAGEVLPGIKALERKV